MRENPYVDPKADPSAGHSIEAVEKIFAHWPQEVHDALAKHGLYAHVTRYRDDHAAIRVFKSRGKHLMSAIEINPAKYDLPRLWLLEELDGLLTRWAAAMDLSLDAEEAKAREQGIEP